MSRWNFVVPATLLISTSALTAIADDVPPVTPPSTKPANLVAPANPVLWKPGTPPTLTPNMDDKLYAQRRAEILGKINRTLLDDKDAPVAGLQIVSVVA